MSPSLGLPNVVDGGGGLPGDEDCELLFRWDNNECPYGGASRARGP